MVDDNDDDRPAKGRSFRFPRGRAAAIECANDGTTGRAARQHVSQDDLGAAAGPFAASPRPPACQLGITMNHHIATADE